MSSGAKKTERKRSSSKLKKGSGLERTLTKQQEAKVESAFSKFCEDPDSGLTASELSQIRTTLGFSEDLKACAAAVGAFAPKGMSLDSLKIHCAQLYGELSAKTELIKVFKLFDKTGSGRITRRTIREAAAEVGEKMTEDSIREMILVADVNKRGYIEENEFVDFMLVAWGSR